MNTITMCQGNFTLMTDDLPREIRRFGDKISFVHFRDVSGVPDKFEETWHDAGKTDMLACMRAYRDIGFDGVLRPDHVPTVEGDSNSECRLLGLRPALCHRLHPRPAAGRLCGDRRMKIAVTGGTGASAAPSSNRRWPRRPDRQHRPGDPPARDGVDFRVPRSPTTLLLRPSPGATR